MDAQADVGIRCAHFPEDTLSQGVALIIFANLERLILGKFLMQIVNRLCSLGEGLGYWIFFFFFFFFFLFILRFYGPVNPVGSCRARSVYLSKLLLDRLSPLSC